MEQHQIAVLGSTGTIGLSTLEVVRLNPERFKIISLAAKSNIEVIKSQIEEFKPSLVALFDKAAATKLKAELEESNAYLPEIISGPNSSSLAATAEGVQSVVLGIQGYKALAPLISAIRANLGIALANKESIVAAGELVKKELEQSSSKLIPVDSEHNSIYQLLERADEAEVTEISLTASGGPFLHHSKEELELVTPEEAVKHPKWNMGAKISVDSATLINKGLELIEAHYLFNVPEKKIKIIIHPNSIIHGVIEYSDSSQQAVLYSPDMKVPIAHALARLSGQTAKLANAPLRVSSGVSKLNLATEAKLEFYPACEDKFKSLALARYAVQQGGISPCIFNAASEFATELFLAKKIKFTDITDLVESALDIKTDIFPFDKISSVEEAEKVDIGIRAELKKLLPNFRNV